MTHWDVYYIGFSHHQRGREGEERDRHKSYTHTHTPLTTHTALTHATSHVCMHEWNHFGSFDSAALFSLTPQREPEKKHLQINLVFSLLIFRFIFPVAFLCHLPMFICIFPVTCIIFSMPDSSFSLSLTSINYVCGCLSVCVCTLGVEAFHFSIQMFPPILKSSFVWHFSFYRQNKQNSFSHEHFRLLTTFKNGKNRNETYTVDRKSISFEDEKHFFVRVTEWVCVVVVTFASFDSVLKM